MRLAVLVAFAAAPASAEPPLTATDFDALTLGRTMTWSKLGSVYGVETYLPDRRVFWSEMGDDCKAGHWYQDGAAICFQYEDDPAPDCWIITQTGPDLSARYTADAPGAEPVIVSETDTAPACLGPKVGV